MQDAAISVVLSLPAEAQTLNDAMLFLEVQDTTEIDARARTVLHEEHHLEPADFRAGTLVFQVRFRIEAAKAYTLRALLDVDGDGQPSKGDFLTTRSYPVTSLTGKIQIKLIRIE